LTTGGSSRPLYRTATRAAWLGLLANALLGGVKLVAGLLGNSFALLSDAVNSLGDSLTSAVVLYALHVAQRPADDEHPYGHTRAEAIAASNVALVIVLSALAVGWEAARRLTAIHEPPPIWTLWIAAANVVIKEGLYQYQSRVGTRIASTATVAHAWDHRSDAFCSLAVLIGLAVVRFGGTGWNWADEVAALVVVSFIVWSGAILFRRSASELMDPQANQELVSKIRELAEQVEGVRAVEKLWVRKTGLEYLADIHIEVAPQMTVADGHLIGHRVKDALVGAFPALRDVLVHLEPYPHVHPQQKAKTAD
jgi:cation diffusion facilitator family transporter